MAAMFDAAMKPTCMTAAAMVLAMSLAEKVMAGGAREKATSVDGLFRDFSGGVPGASVIVMLDGRVLFKKAYGYADLEPGSRATPRTVYRLASVSKQFTALAVLMLAEQRKLSLDDDLTRFFPEFPAYGRAIRVRHLLSHTSGLLAYEDLMPEGDAPVLDRDVLEILSKQDRTCFPPGTKFRYSNSGYALLALIVEKTSSMAFPDFLQHNIFRPLGMKSSFLNLRSAPANPRRAYGYSKREASFERTDQSRTSYVLGDGGIYSSVEDLVQWERSLLKPRLLNPTSLQETMQAHIAVGEDGTGYGYGWYVGRHKGEAAVWHEGSTSGFSNAYLRLPRKKLAVIVLTNRRGFDAVPLARAVADLFLAGQP